MAAAVAVGDVRGANLVCDSYSRASSGPDGGAVSEPVLVAFAAWSSWASLNASRAGAIDAGGVPLYETNAFSVR